VAKSSYALAGEDLLVARLLGSDEDIRYLDIGCLWPIDHSNTYLFYRNGGRGVCIDPNPGLEAEFSEIRPRDVFLNLAVGAEEEVRPYYIFESIGLNTFLAPRATWLSERADKRSAFQLRETIELQVRSLDAALSEVDVPTRPDGGLDFMSIDVEGLEYEILSGFSFEPRPKLVMCEQNASKGLQKARQGKLHRLMEDRGYIEVAHTGHDAFFLTRGG
jgi:FkbM family methyltransferase